MFDIASDKLLTIGDILSKMKISRRTFERIRKHRSLIRFPAPVIIIGNSPRWSEQDVNCYINFGKGTPMPDDNGSGS